MIEKTDSNYIIKSKSDKNNYCIQSTDNIHKTLEQRKAESQKPICFERNIDWGKSEGKEIW